jgi:hypothetical protein
MKFFEVCAYLLSHPNFYFFRVAAALIHERMVYVSSVVKMVASWVGGFLKLYRNPPVPAFIL